MHMHSKIPALRAQADQQIGMGNTISIGILVLGRLTSGASCIR
jgi:hypothetical protein